MSPGLVPLTPDLAALLGALIPLEQPYYDAASPGLAIAQTLKRLGVSVVFGVVGIPVVDVADACTAQGMRFIGFRNEQSASYAASAWGYLTGQPGVCLVVSGPGVVHALPGVLNAQANCWPLVLLGGSSETGQRGWGAFQELTQVEVCRSYTKYAARPASATQIPRTLQAAFRHAINGRPGPCYVDLPADFIQGTVAPVEETWGPVARALTGPDASAVAQAVACLQAAKAPLVIIGKGVALARAEDTMRELIDRTNWPFLPTSMGKGVVSDNHPRCVSAARSAALAEADVVLLLGARLNWMLHFGQRFRSDVKIIQADVCPEELGHNRSAHLTLAGDLSVTVAQLVQAIRCKPQFVPFDSTHSVYWTSLASHTQRNQAKLAAKCTDDAVPMSYHRAFTEIKTALQPVYDQVVLVSEGANTMDIARGMFDLAHPRRRLDAGTLATMGVGMGYAIAAQVYYATQRVVAIVGDSAFGFSAMEAETAVRAHLAPIIIVINNSGIYHGVASDSDYQAKARSHTLPSTALSPNARYELIAEAVGGKGYLARTPQELFQAVGDALGQSTLCLINCIIRPGSQQKLEFNWLPNKAQPKL
ncbi:hypothetical protein H4R34_001126 [Dimargaris verticillata]|uniref:2-hydroxyacyl-CoA lyase n=1 Tax=Dimargaris verticillata TaxID=2761393 RepID=A0A9W8EFA2_9FUNG|nr:hypothetical protein H4R34_001126 [Dimargaris verticillata]